MRKSIVNYVVIELYNGGHNEKKTHCKKETFQSYTFEKF